MAVAEIRPDWTIGTLTLTSGSKNFTTAGSALQTAAIQSGDEIITRSGHVLIIATITGQNSGTLMENCPAAAAGAAQPLRIRFQPDGSRYNGATADLVQRLGSGNVYEFSGLVGAADRVPYFTGPGTMALTALTPFARGVIGAVDGSAAYGALGVVPDAQISETLPQAKAYRRGNVIGNVSQSGGVPTGYLMQRGSNANGEFLRYADGTMICWSGVMDLTFTNSWILRKTWNYPIQFSSPPNVSSIMLSPYFYNGTGYSSEQLVSQGGSMIMQRYESTISATIDLTRPTVGPWISTDILRGKSFAIGRWF